MASATVAAVVFLLGMGLRKSVHGEALATAFGVAWPLAGFWLAYRLGLPVSRMWHRGRVPQSAA
jgi:hypothetical protein